MRARDLMTASLVTIPPEAPLEAVAQILSGRGISAPPWWMVPASFSAWCRVQT